jgi:RimJ/RimL family protein N-acetyltransferase
LPRIKAPITTERLRLRPFVEADLDDLHKFWSDPDIGKWVGGAHTRLTESVQELDGHLRHHADHGFGVWAAEERDSGRLVGEVGLQYLDGGPDVEIGWVVARDAWGQGYATEAARKWIEVGFADLGLDRILAVVLPANMRSRAIATRLGMREIGTRDAYGAEHVEFELTRARFTS